MSHRPIEEKREAREVREEAKAAREHELAMTKTILDWIATTTPKRGDIITLTVPADKFIYPGTHEDDMTDEQKHWMEQCHAVLGTILQNLGKMGILAGGAAILGEGMTLADLPPPWEKHPDARDPSERIVTPGKKLYLPPGTKI